MPKTSSVSVSDSTPATAVAPENFESAMEELETLISKMDGEMLGLEELLHDYTRANQLLSYCQTRLNEAQQRVELIATGRDGSVQLEPFSPVSDSPTSARSAKSGAKTASPTSTTDSDDDIRLH
jgi:exodeoxyribonuclease VII small subunit